MVEALVAFCGAALLVSMVPGPSTVVIMRESALGGRAAGIAALAGNEAGMLGWALVAAAGLSALLAVSELAYDVLRVTGAAVLVWLGAQTLWRARRPPAPGGDRLPAATSQRRLWRSFRTGVVTAAANPKAGVFVVSFLPQFIPPGAPVPAMLPALALLWVAIDVIWYLGMVWLVGTLRPLVTRPQVQRRLEQACGALLVGLGARLAAESR